MKLEIKKENVEFSKIKLLVNGGAKLDFNAKIPLGHEEHNWNAKGDTWTIDPSAVIKDAIKEITPYLLKYLGYDLLRTAISNEKMNPTDSQLSKLQDSYNYIIGRYRINAVQFCDWGKEDRRAVMLYYSYEDSAGLVMDGRSCKIFLGQEIHKFESELEEICSVIIDELYEYRFNGKRDQLEIPHMHFDVKKGEANKNDKPKEIVDTTINKRASKAKVVQAV